MSLGELLHLCPTGGAVTQVTAQGSTTHTVIFSAAVMIMPMKVSTRAEYGLLALVDLALFSSGRPLPAKQMAVPPGLLPVGAITTPGPVPTELQADDITAFGGTAFYGSTTNFAYSDVNWKPIKRLALRLGYVGTFANGKTLFLNLDAPVGPLQYAYQKPYARFTFDLAKGFAFKTTWTYYGYNPRSSPKSGGPRSDREPGPQCQQRRPGDSLFVLRKV